MRDGIRNLIRVSISRRDQAAADRLNDADFLKLSLADIPKDATGVISRYKDTLIGYDFYFNIVENNDASAGADILHTFTRGALGFRADAALLRERETEKGFRVVDSFGRLATGVSNEYCNFLPTGYNYLFPMTGRLDLRGEAQEFLSLNQSANLADKEGGGEIARSYFKRKFTTTQSAGLKPDLGLTPRGLDWDLAGVDADVSAKRKDIHQVTVVFLLPAAGDKRDETIAEDRVQRELDYLRQRDDLRAFGSR